MMITIKIQFDDPRAPRNLKMYEEEEEKIGRGAENDVCR